LKNLVLLRLMKFFGDIITMKSLNDVITDFLNFDLVIFSLKNYNLVKSGNFRSPKSKIKGRWGWRAPSVGNF